MQAMGTEVPTPVVIPVLCAPKKAPCPKCGKHGRRKRKLPPRRVRTVVYKAVAFLEILCGEYQARCGCCKTFRNTPEDVLSRALYDNKVRDLVLDRILKDAMNVEQTMESLRREYLLDLSTGFVYDVLHGHAEALDMSEHRRASPYGPEALQRHAVRRRTAPGSLHLATGHRPAERLARGLRPGRRQRPRPHGAVPQEPQDLGLEPHGRGDRRLESVSHGAGGTLARRRSSAMRLSRDQGYQQVDPGRRAADADGDGSAGQGRAEEGAGPQRRPVQGRRLPPGPVGQGEGEVRVQTSSPDRETPGEAHRVGARRPDADAAIRARVRGVATVRRSDLLGIRHAQGLSPSQLPSGCDRAQPGLSSGAGVGQSVGATR